ncbi:hypothetical protein M8J77_014300 [Diaphorina citri]|nr:hypothetical protein M8J77_014300 [Diaphorina citri]
MKKEKARKGNKKETKMKEKARKGNKKEMKRKEKIVSPALIISHLKNLCKSARFIRSVCRDRDKHKDVEKEDIGEEKEGGEGEEERRGGEKSRTSRKVEGKDRGEI